MKAWTVSNVYVILPQHVSLKETQAYSNYLTNLQLYNYYSSVEGVIIGFEQPMYEVGEGDGSVNFRIRVIMGMLRRDVVVSVATQDDTAMGKSTVCDFAYIITSFLI